jgi:hypothetical protein
VFVPEPDLVNTQHNAPYLRNRGPGKSICFIERLQPSLNLERLNIIRDVLAEPLDEVVANIMLKDRKRSTQVSPSSFA